MSDGIGPLLEEAWVRLRNWRERRRIKRGVEAAFRAKDRRIIAPPVTWTDEIPEMRVWKLDGASIWKSKSQLERIREGYDLMGELCDEIYPYTYVKSWHEFMALYGSSGFYYGAPPIEFGSAADTRLYRPVSSGPVHTN